MEKKFEIYQGVGLPLLDLVETLEKGDRDEDDDGLLAVADLNLL